MGVLTIAGSKYGGERSQQTYAAALIGNNFVDKGLCVVHTNAKNEIEVPLLEQAVQFQASIPGFNAQNLPTSYVPLRLELRAYSFMESIQFNNLRQSFEAQKLAPGSLNDYSSNELLAFYIERSVQRLADLNELLYIQGIAATSPNANLNINYPGLIPSLVAAAGVRKIGLGAFSVSGIISSISQSNDRIIEATFATTANPNLANIQVGDNVTISSVNAAVSGLSTLAGQTGNVIAKTVSGTNTILIIDGIIKTNVSLSSTPADNTLTLQYINESNVYGVIKQVINATPKQVRKLPTYYIAVSEDILTSKIFRDQETGSGQGVSGSDLPQTPGYMALSDEGMFGQYRVVAVPNFPPNTIMGTHMNNIHLSVDLIDDDQRVEVADLRATLLENTVRVKANMKSFIRHAFDNEVVLLRPGN